MWAFSVNNKQQLLLLLFNAMRNVEEQNIQKNSAEGKKDFFINDSFYQYPNMMSNLCEWMYF